MKTKTYNGVSYIWRTKLASNINDDRSVYIRDKKGKWLAAKYRLSLEEGETVYIIETRKTLGHWFVMTKVAGTLLGFELSNDEVTIF